MVLVVDDDEAAEARLSQWRRDHDCVYPYVEGLLRTMNNVGGAREV